MGYCITLDESKFTMTAANAKLALAKLKALAKRPESKSGRYSFGFCEIDEMVSSKTFSDIMEAIRWPVDVDDAMNVTGIDFNGEKLADDKKLLSAIAEFVDDGSYLEIRGEDGGLWRWVFKAGKLTEVSPKVSWE